MFRQYVVREVVDHYRGLLRLRDVDLCIKFVGRIPPSPGEEKVFMTIADDDENAHRFTLEVARCALYLPADLLIEKVLHELAHIFLWPLDAETEAEHLIVDKLALVWRDTLPRPDL